MPKKTILFDMDGVIVDQIPLWLEIYNSEYKDNLTIDEFAGSWNLHKIVKPEVGEKVYDILNRPDFYEKAKPIDGAIDGIKDILSSGKFNVFIVSAFMGNGNQAKGKCDWINRYLTDIDRDNIFLCHEKQLIIGDILVDDSEKNLIKWCNVMDAILPNLFSNKPEALMMTAPHNKDLDLNQPLYQGIFRISNWKELLEYIFNID